ncbi:MAG: sulfate permease [Desulfobacteraceae bacterium]|nr:sulfate permease [Desulfobacteraceae bacterium]
MSLPYKFNRLELAGSLGDLGTLLPIAVGMIVVNGLNPTGVFFSIGVFYILTGFYYGVTTPVQPMKVIGAYAIATAMSTGQVMAAGLMVGSILMIIGLTGAIDIIGKYAPKSVIRGVQLSTGIILLSGGVRMILGQSQIQQLKNAAEPYLLLQHIGPVPVGIVIGIIGFLVTLLLLENKKMPAALVVICSGILIGWIFGIDTGREDISIQPVFPRFFPVAFPGKADFVVAIFALVLPQIPMTIGNAVIADADLSASYFGEHSRKVTHRALCITMALGNLLSFVFGGMPLCHGAGGLAAHYRFGARSAGSNLIIGGIFLTMALFFGHQILSVVSMIPFSILGVLLMFAGGQLALTILDMKTRKEMFVPLLMLGITLASSLAVGFIAGMILAYALLSERLSV